MKTCLVAEMDGFRLGEAFESIDDVMNVGITNIQLQWLIWLQRNGVLVARNAKLGANLAAKDFGDGRLCSDMAGRPGHGGLLLVAHLQPAVGRRIIRNVGRRHVFRCRCGAGRRRRGRCFESLHTFFMQLFQQKAEEFLSILLMATL
jgi:hypothetical protein